MKIEVNYDELYNLGNYMENMFEELKKDLEEINIISESLNSVLQGSAEQTISTRMKNFNSTQFSQVVNYTHLLGNEVTNCAKAYNAEDDEFAQKMKREASKYGIEDSTVVGDLRYQTQNTTSAPVSSFATQTSTTNVNNNSDVSKTTDVENRITENNTEFTQQAINNNSQNNTFDDIIIEEVKTNSESIQNVNFEAQTQETINSNTINTPTQKSKGVFGGIFGAAAAAMGLKFASSKKNKEENNTKK